MRIGLIAGVAACLFSGWGTGHSKSALADDQPLYLRPEALAAEEALLAVRYRASPEEAYGVFNTFVKHVFGAEADELIYEKYGHELILMEAGDWLHASERSAAIAWETNLPAVSHVEYGPTEALGQKTEPTDRHYFLHIHHLTGLEPGQTYHAQLVAIDERGNTLRGPMQRFATLAAGTLTPIGADHTDGPIVISEPGRYVLVRDITSTTSGINIEADNVMLDLGGHTITYATTTLPEDHFEDKWRSYEIKGSIGVRNLGHSNFTLLNGTIRQGVVDPFANTGNDDTSGYNPVFIRDASDVHVAGLVVDYNSRQNTGILNRSMGDNQLFHHNVIRDRGLVVRNRHGAGCRAIHFFGGGGENHVVRHNLVARSRQNGLNLSSPGGRLIHNEVYIDSWSTNSFAMGVPNGVDEDDPGQYGNRIFATGFNPYGFGWATENLRVHNNLIYMHGLDTTHRWHEKWGDINLLAALRVTNYGGGGQERRNLRYDNNLIILRSKQGANVQGTRFFSDETIEGIVFHNNTVKMERLDDVPALHSGAVVTHGYFRKDNSLPVVYRDSTLISNYAIVQFGEAYGRGNNHHFENVRFVRIGDHADFATFRFGGQYHSNGHVILDGVFEGGAAVDDVHWQRTGPQSNYSVQWTLKLTTTPGAAVTATDAQGKVAFEGVAGDDGTLSIALTEARYSMGDGPRQSKVVSHTPHTLTVGSGASQQTHEVNMTQPRELVVR